MRSLWFKSVYVAPILAGTKTSTVRRGRHDWPIGGRLALSVGPRRPFAIVEVAGVEPCDIEGLSEDERHSVALLYPNDTQFTRLRFRLVAVPDAADLVGGQ